MATDPALAVKRTADRLRMTTLVAAAVIAPLVGFHGWYRISRLLAELGGPAR